MNKIVCLTPCYMKENVRKRNHHCLSILRENFDFDEFVIYDQAFSEEDYDNRFTYIGHQPEGVGFIKPRNDLLKWFYESDYDYAFWIDANSTISKPTRNDVHTLIHYCKNNKLDDIDAIFSTLGIINDAERIKLKQEIGYKNKLTLLPAKYDAKSNWFHGLLMKNFNKYYHETPYIDERFDPRANNGLVEDVYFSRLIRKLYNCYHAPTIIVNKPNSNYSTHQDNGTGKYNYAKINYAETDRVITENAKNFSVKTFYNKSIIELPRVEKDHELMEDFKSRPKDKQNIISLFG